ncbi:MAG: hypothetical protein ACRCYU_14360 [Nocardioides sp.]
MTTHSKTPCPDSCLHRTEHAKLPIDYHYAPVTTPVTELAREPQPPAWVHDIHRRLEDDSTEFVSWLARPDDAWPIEVAQNLHVTLDGHTVLYPVYLTGADALPEIMKSDDWLRLADSTMKVLTAVHAALEASRHLQHHTP